MKDSLSVLLPARNSQAVLENRVADILEVLSDLASQLEVLIIDDGSDDGTEEIAWDLAARYMQVDYVRHPYPLGMLETLRTGYESTAGEYLLIPGVTSEWNIELMAQIWQSRLTTPDTAAGDPRYRRSAMESGSDEPGWLQRLTEWGRSILVNQPSMPAAARVRLIRRHELTEFLTSPHRSAELRWDPGTSSEPHPHQAVRHQQPAGRTAPVRLEHEFGTGSTDVPPSLSR